jgi:hypothetical protein
MPCNERCQRICHLMLERHANDRDRLPLARLTVCPNELSRNINADKGLTRVSLFAPLACTFGLSRRLGCHRK